MNYDKAVSANIKTVLVELKKAYSVACTTKKTEAQQWIYDTFESFSSALQAAGKALKPALRGASADYVNKRLSAAKKLVYGNAKLTEQAIENALKDGGLPDELCPVIREIFIYLLSQKLKEGLENLNDEVISSVFSEFSHLDDIDFSYLSEELSTAAACLKKYAGEDYLSETAETREHDRFLILKRAKAHKRSVEDEIKALTASAKKQGVHYGSIISDIGLLKKTGAVLSVSKWIIPLILGVVFSVLLSSFSGLLLILPLYSLFGGLLYFITPYLVEPVFYPAVELCGKVPPEGKTAIAVSVLLPENGDLTELEKTLKRLTAAAFNSEFPVCALCDFFPSKQKVTPLDGEITEKLKSILLGLSEKYPGVGISAFVRERAFSETQREFIGPERKRGAVEALVRYITKGEVDGAAVLGDSLSLENVRYIFAADADTVVPADSIYKLVSAALHPVNRAVLSKDGKSVKSGWGIFAPKVGDEIASAYRSPFSACIKGGAGFSVYLSRVSEWYADWFSDGIFCGKGLIDTAAYSDVLTDKLRKERVLSHDVIEGAFLRTAYISSAVVCDSVPASPRSYFTRAERWHRGDFQNICMIFGKKRVPSAGGVLRIIDNCVIALVPLGIMLCLIFAGFSGYGRLLWAFSVAAIFFWTVFDFAGACILNPGTVFCRTFSRSVSVPVRSVLKSAVIFCFLPTEAAVSLSALVRTVYRLLISKRNLLQWTVFSGSSGGRATAARVTFQVALGIYFLLCADFLLKLTGAAFLLGAVLYFVLALPFKMPEPVPEKIRAYLGRRAQLMWQYFEDYCDLNSNYLPPDHVDFNNNNKVETKTSPTNIGFYLLSIAGAADLRLITHNKAYSLLDKAFESIEKMPKYHGNLYNWYDTSTLQPVEPYFASSVDSGNFLCSVVALKEWLKAEKSPEPLCLSQRAEKLLRDTDFSVFYNKKRRLLYTGIDIKTDSPSESHYDLLMSEMRMTSYYAVATGAVPEIHWRSMSRESKSLDGYSGFLSWTGTVFEYFMSELFLPDFEGTAVHESTRYAFSAHRKAVKKMGIPFGISESAYNKSDKNGGYCYKADGAAAAAKKNGVGKNFAVAPYASFLMLEADPDICVDNLKKLEQDGGACSYGFFDAVDYTASPKSPVPVKTVMAHHVGMSFLSCVNVLSGGRLRELFLSDPAMSSKIHLLFEEV